MNSNAANNNTTHCNATSSVAGALVIGAGRHAAEVVDALLACGQAVAGCLDGSLDRGTQVLPAVVVLGSDRDLASFVADGFTKVYLGIGGMENLGARIKWFHNMEELGVTQSPLIHPSAHVSATARLGWGTTVLACASVGPLTTIGCNCVLTQNAVVTHHAQLGDHVMLAPNATLAAGVCVHDEVTIGMGVTVYHDVSIGRRSIVVNGVHVMQNIPDEVIVKQATPPPVVRPRS